MTENKESRLPSGFHERAFLALSIVTLLLMVPLGAVNFVTGESLRGWGVLGISMMLAFNSWSILVRGKYLAWLTILGLLPAIILSIYASLNTMGLYGLLWIYPAILAFYVIVPERMAWLANVVLVGIGAPVVMDLVGPVAAARIGISLFLTSAIAAVFTRTIITQQQRLEALAYTDALTGLYNRMLLPTMMDHAAARHLRTGEPMALMSLDLDHFKKINDTRGHAAGDTVLTQVAQILKSRMRATDYVFRTGGEEFLLLLHETDKEGARRVAEDLRNLIRDAEILPDLRVTASFGISELQSGDDLEQWLNRGDAMLYAAKLGGRDRVVA